MKHEYQAAMERVKMPPECEARILAALEHDPVKHKKTHIRTVIAIAAAVFLLVSSTVAVSYQTGVLNTFFKGNSSVLEPYIQYPDSVSNGDYRLSINGALYDGNNFYAVLIVEGLNEQAIDDLKSNKVIAESHLDFWGQDMVDRLLASGGSGPDTFHLLNASGISTRELSPPDEASRAWRISGNFMEAPEKTESIGLWLDFIGRDYIVNIPINNIITPITLYPEQPDCIEVTIYATSVKAVFLASGMDSEMLQAFSVVLEDGSILTQDDLGLRMNDGTYDPLTMRYECNYLFDVPIDPARITTVSINGIEVAVS
ncbi:MAG: DUF4179 domain-containing protein [Oscillospiraceae bacterium]|nr:DUF4179 domain-containing protein [Oscillospiraceae bacterium]